MAAKSCMVAPKFMEIASCHPFGAQNFEMTYFWKICVPQLSVGRDSVVGIATCYGLDCPGIEFR